MQLRARHRLSILFLAVLAGFLSCREPTQITVVLTTDASCPNGQPPRLIDLTLGTGRTVDPRNFIEAAVSAACSDDSDGQSPVQNELGTLVLLPGDGDDKTVEIIVIAGVESQATNPNIQAIAKQQTSEQCKLLIQEGGLAAVGGTACIVARRRLSFIDHTRLVVPIDLDTRCIGKECDESSTCYQGNCVPITIECPEQGGDCSTPPSCGGQACDEQCDSRSGECKDGQCGCGDCDAVKCANHCELSGFVGSCEDNQCVCQPRCEAQACTDLCNGTCSEDGTACNCDTCDEVQCGMFPCPAGGFAQCLQPEDLCGCPGCVSEEDCAVLPLPCTDGQLPDCVPGDPTSFCVCTCDDDECAADCGGSCDAGLCGCDLPCDESVCDDLLCPGGEIGTCDAVTNGCVCECRTNLCTSHCAGMNQTGACNAANDECICTSDPVTTSSSASGMMSGGGGAGGVGGLGGAGGVGGVGGTGGCFGCPGGCPQGEFCDGCACVCDDMNCLTSCGGSCDAGNKCDCANCFDGMCGLDCQTQGYPGGSCVADLCDCTECTDDSDCAVLPIVCGGFYQALTCQAFGNCACTCDVSACNAGCVGAGLACEPLSCSCVPDGTGGAGGGTAGNGSGAGPGSGGGGGVGGAIPPACPQFGGSYGDFATCTANCLGDCTPTGCFPPTCVPAGPMVICQCGGGVM